MLRGSYFLKKFQFIGQLEKRVIARERRDRGNLLRYGFSFIGVLKTLQIAPGDSQEVNCPKGAREATVECGPYGPGNDIVVGTRPSALPVGEARAR